MGSEGHNGEIPARDGDWTPARLELGAVATITLDRPAAANCLSRRTIEELRAAVAAIAGDPGVRAVVVTGAGDRAFCAGADLKERASMSDEAVMDFIRAIRDTLTALSRLPQPVVCAINGGAFGGGCEIALACDVRVMSDAATIGLTETSLAIIPGGGGTQRLPRLVGRGRALEMLATARRLGADEALRVGLIEEVAPAASVRERAREIAQAIAANGPIAVRLAKQAATLGLELPLDEGLLLETELYATTLGTADRREGLEAFREKRPPVYRGE